MRRLRLSINIYQYCSKRVQGTYNTARPLPHAGSTNLNVSISSIDTRLVAKSQSAFPFSLNFKRDTTNGSVLSRIPPHVRDLQWNGFADMHLFTETYLSSFIKFVILIGYQEDMLRGDERTYRFIITWFPLLHLLPVNVDLDVTDTLGSICKCGLKRLPLRIRSNFEW